MLSVIKNHKFGNRPNLMNETNGTDGILTCRFISRFFLFLHLGYLVNICEKWIYSSSFFVQYFLPFLFQHSFVRFLCS